MNGTPEARAPRRDEAGFSLVIAVTIVALLTFLGLMVMDAVRIDTELAGADRSANSALYVAEAGVTWAKDTLAEPPYFLYHSEPSGRHPEEIPNGTAAPLADACPEGPPCTTDFVWYYLDITKDEADAPIQLLTKRGNTEVVVGTYTVFAAYDDLGDPSDTNWVVRVRSLGRSIDGARRMIEVHLGPGEM